MRFLYLHGFASGPTSTKARFFAARLEELGLRLETPELSQGQFESLTVTAQLSFVQTLLGNDQAILIGSSLGGYLAALLAAQNPRIRKLILLAPAFGFLQLWKQRVGAVQIERWRETNQLPVFHYGEGRWRALGYQLMNDAEQYPLYPHFSQPALIVHGTRDDVVPAAESERFAESHPNARLVLVPSGHELTDALPTIWAESQTFFPDLIPAK